MRVIHGNRGIVFTVPVYRSGGKGIMIGSKANKVVSISKALNLRSHFNKFWDIQKCFKDTEV